MSGVLPVIVGATIVLNSSTPVTYITDPISPYAGFPYEWRLRLLITVVGNSLPYGSFDTTFIKAGQWLAVSNGMTYMLTNVEAPSSQTDIFVTVRDVDLYNLQLDNSNSQANAPTENIPGLIFSLGENGVPSISNTTILNAIGTWIEDVIGRFTSRNYYEEFYTNFNLDIAYYGFSIGQLVYIGNSNGIYQFLPVVTTNTDQIEDAFGIVTSVNWPQTGNMNVRPFGKVIADIPYVLPGNTGDALYYDSSNPPSFCTSIKPATNPVKLYIKLDSNVASVLYGQGSGGGSGSGATGPTGPAGAISNLTLNNSYVNNGINLAVPVSVSSPLTLGSTVTISKPSNIWVSVSLNFISSASRSHTIFAFASVNGSNSNIYTSTISGLHDFNQFGYLQFSFQHHAYAGVTGTIPLSVSMYSTSNTSSLVKLQQFNIFALGNL
jgi:hypothetical protein